jgi:signal peptidase
MNFIPSAPHFVYVVVSDSMVPTINKGDVVIALPKGMQQEQPKVGQIAVFSSPLDNSQIFVHRIVKMEMMDGKRFFITKGDNNPDNDSFPIPESKAIGTVQYIIPYAGTILLLPREILLFIGIGLIIAYLAITFLDNRKKGDSSNNTLSNSRSNNNNSRNQLFENNNNNTKDDNN